MYMSQNWPRGLVGCGAFYYQQIVVLPATKMPRLRLEPMSMGEGYNFKRLKAAILALSHADVWDLAKWEWRLVGVLEADEPETCLCGYHPIIEICSIRMPLLRTRLM